ncbi:pyruvate dehydrogenase E1 component subunit beta, mitochondrial-like [Cucumis sativus]|nr:pyruvate dehydrogenase E1 component subunit beta, mitochondrial-like [Cucumis sativus]XP_031739725.1 pyruvate dehydrogenase E1 component subunit beta, mitochondrial-like [Cucumis sativus]XP_031745327.1 pyruvate dehydrogenase E1 component subunit beta, mitochondrial-like [Cucumis sativus]XP_031745515.1 pyruvate dehydrogenase E1 component subunit beta, mitochondrial-like [Cucumis sativus]XP_031745520.1 pyruvate dehydrogenase E1 component subunit beta, mitochondrial-like [Cucumis sativus]XP_03
MTVRDTLNSALDEEMSVDQKKKKFMREEVGEYQETYKITKRILEKYGSERVLDTPITEEVKCRTFVNQVTYFGLKKRLREPVT